MIMNREQIMALTERELDIAVGTHVMGYTRIEQNWPGEWCDDGYIVPFEPEDVDKGVTASGKSFDEFMKIDYAYLLDNGWMQQLPKYHCSRSACAEFEAKLAVDDLCEVYASEVNHLTRASLLPKIVEWWALITTGPEQRCQAALLVKMAQKRAEMEE